jgi:hypothetical protein
MGARLVYWTVAREVKVNGEERRGRQERQINATITDIPPWIL